MRRSHRLEQCHLGRFHATCFRLGGSPSCEPGRGEDQDAFRRSSLRLKMLLRHSSMKFGAATSFRPRGSHACCRALGWWWCRSHCRASGSPPGCMNWALGWSQMRSHCRASGWCLMRCMLASDCDIRVQCGWSTPSTTSYPRQTACDC